MGTVVFPDANPKIYLTASARARAERRHKQLIEKGFSASMPSLSQEQVRRDIEARDQRDAQRAASPLRPAKALIASILRNFRSTRSLRLVLKLVRAIPGTCFTATEVSQ